MIKKIIILGLILLGAFIFYKNFMADTLDPFIGRVSKDKGQVDLLQQKAPAPSIND